MDTKHVRIWMRGWAGDDPDAVATTIADMVLDISDTARVTLACDAVAERFTTGGIAYGGAGRLRPGGAPPCHFEFAAEHGLTWLLEKTYPGVQA